MLMNTYVKIHHKAQYTSFFISSSCQNLCLRTNPEGKEEELRLSFAPAYNAREGS